MPDNSIIEHSYPTSFVSNNDKRAIWLWTLPNKTLCNSVHKFCVSLSCGQQTKARLTKLIMDDLGQQTNGLVQLSIEELYERVSPPLHFLKLQLLLACQFVHSRYGAVVASHLLCEPIHWDPPKLIANHIAVSSVNWLHTSIDQLKLRLSKVDPSAIKMCCQVYLSPKSLPKSKTGRYGVVAEWFWLCSLSLFGLSDIEFLKNYLALFPFNLPAHEVSHQQLVETILKEEFSCEISDQLLSPPPSEKQKEKKKQACRKNHVSSVINTREARDAYIRLWPQLVPEDVALKCANAYYQATQPKMPPICCVCLR